ncbi:hypothetical protein JW872_01035 [Candidatus Babeliales bacterium]|nr:hypothetical protein [Candidatus Babeliales bacterium]
MKSQKNGFSGLPAPLLRLASLFQIDIREGEGDVQDVIIPFKKDPPIIEETSKANRTQGDEIHINSRIFSPRGLKRDVPQVVAAIQSRDDHADGINHQIKNSLI